MDLCKFKFQIPMLDRPFFRSQGGQGSGSLAPYSSMSVLVKAAEHDSRLLRVWQPGRSWQACLPF